MYKDMMAVNDLWGSYLNYIGFIEVKLPNWCPNCYTVREFCSDFPKGRYMLATGRHVIAVIDGDYYDTWDSGSEIPIAYWRKEN